MIDLNQANSRAGSFGKPTNRGKPVMVAGVTPMCDVIAASTSHSKQDPGPTPVFSAILQKLPNSRVRKMGLEHIKGTRFKLLSFFF